MKHLINKNIGLTAFTLIACLLTMTPKSISDTGISDTGISDSGVYSLSMEFSPPDTFMLDTMTGSPAIVPPDGQLLVFGRMDHVGLAIESINNITVDSHRGERLSLMIDKYSIIKEFGSIVSLRFAFEIPLSEAGDGDSGYRIVWGGNINAENIEVEQIYIDPDRPGLYRQFRWREILAGNDGAEAPFSTIVVIADSTAEYHFLWYLLPMGLVFSLLTIRKIRARNTSD